VINLSMCSIVARNCKLKFFNYAVRGFMAKHKEDAGFFILTLAYASSSLTVYICEIYSSPRAASDGVYHMAAESEILRKHLDQLLFDIKRGFLQYTVLALINQCPKYAYEIKSDVYRVTGGTFDIDRNNLYKKLRALEKDGILKSTEHSSEMGANRKYYVLTPFGKKFFKEVSKVMVPVIDSFYNRIHEFS